MSPMSIRMSSKIGYFFYVSIHFVLGAFFLLTGLFSLILPWSSFLQNKTIQFILSQTLIFFLFGLGLTLIGVSILTYASLRSKRRYVSIRSGKQAISIDEELIQNYLENYWKEHFPKNHIPSYLTIKKNSLEIVADLPAIPQIEQKIFLEKVQQDFNELFGQVLGYPHDVHLTVSFLK